jgi:hypothetical protein
MDKKLEYCKLASKADAYEAVKLAVTPEMLARFQVKATLEYQEDLISAKGKGFKLDMGFDETGIWYKLDLSFLLKPLKGKILAGIEKQLNRII